jgi:predicted NACHT family NTPase
MAVPAAYLRYLRQQTGWLDTPEFGRAPIEERYIPLTGHGPSGELAELEHALAHRLLAIVGGPGSGKTTFLRHIAFLWCCGLEDTRTDSLPLPVFIRIPELMEHVRAEGESPHPLADFLCARNRDFEWGLSDHFIREKLRAGCSVVLLDGLNEAAPAEREPAARLIRNAARAFRQCRFVVATRPEADGARAALEGFETVTLAPRGLLQFSITCP